MDVMSTASTQARRESQTELNEFLNRCEENLSSLDELHRISIAAAVSLSSREVVANVQSDHEMLGDLGLEDPSTMAVRWDKVIAIDAIGGIVGGAEGAVGSSAISLIMMS